MGGLSPNPIDQTNNLLVLLLMNANNSSLTQNVLNPPFVPAQGVVRQNCFFFASLFSSLIAAAGAVLTKQWLANYERTGQSGPLKEQSLLRTEKFLGAERWGLRYVVEALPTLIILSLALFFVAVSDYVWNLSKEVAILIITLSAAGTACYALMVLLAACFPQCPYQTVSSQVLAYCYYCSLVPTLLVMRNSFLCLVAVLGMTGWVLAELIRWAG